jgi:hypothetical protein
MGLACDNRCRADLGGVADPLPGQTGGALASQGGQRFTDHE